MLFQKNKKCIDVDDERIKQMLKVRVYDQYIELVYFNIINYYNYNKEAFKHEYGFYDSGYNHDNSLYKIENKIINSLYQEYVREYIKFNKKMFDDRSLLEIFPEMVKWRIGDILDISGRIINYDIQQQIDGYELCILKTNGYEYLGFNNKKRIFFKFIYKDIERIGWVDICFFESGDELYGIVNSRIFYEDLENELSEIKRRLGEGIECK